MDMARDLERKFDRYVKDVQLLEASASSFGTVQHIQAGQELMMRYFVGFHFIFCKLEIQWQPQKSCTWHQKTLSLLKRFSSECVS